MMCGRDVAHDTFARQSTTITNKNIHLYSEIYNNLSQKIFTY